MDIQGILNQIIAISLSAFTVVIWGISVIMLITGAIVIIKGRGSERWAGLVIVIATLLVLPTTIRDYPPELAKASAESFTGTMPYLQQLAGDVNAALTAALNGSGPAPDAPQPTAVPDQPTAVPPTPTDDPNAGGGSGDISTAVPTETPIPPTETAVPTNTPAGIPGATATMLWATVSANDATRYAEQEPTATLQPTPTLAPTATPESLFPGVPLPPTPVITPRS